MRLAVLPGRTAEDERLIAAILARVDVGLAHFLRSGTLDVPAARRLGFSEIGLAIGLQTLLAIAEAAQGSGNLERPVAPHLEQLQDNAGAGSRFVTFWSDSRNRRAATWTEHRDINEVMLATALTDAYAGTAAIGPVSQPSPAEAAPHQP